MKVVLTNRWAKIDCDPDVQVELKTAFRFRPPGYEFAPSYRDGSWDGWRNFLLRGRVPTGLFCEKLEELAGAKAYRFDVADWRKYPEIQFLPDGNMRPYQKEALSAMLEASNTGGLILIATGGGKTRLAGDYFRCLKSSGLFIVDELALLEQSRIEIEKVLQEKVGVVGRSEFSPQRITIATIQTLAKHKDRADFREWFSILEVLIIDEIHLALNKRNLDIVTQIKPLAVFGLTATLELQKPHVRIPAVALAGPVIYTYPITRGVEEGYLSEGVVCRVLFHDPLRGRAPGYWSTNAKGEKIFIPPWSSQADYRYRIAQNKARNDCIEEIVREGVKQGRRVVVLLEQLPHLKILSQRLRDIKHTVVSGAQKTSVRLDAIHRMDAGELPLILASRVFSKGVDVRSVDVIIDGTALPGRNSAMQRYGRGARKADGKLGLLYVDISDRVNSFAGAAHSRSKALQETGARTVTVKWKPGASKKIFDPALSLMLAQTRFQAMRDWAYG